MSDYEETLARCIRRYGEDSPEVRRLRSTLIELEAAAEPDGYTAKLRQLAQSVLAGVQRLEERGAVTADDEQSHALAALNAADNDVWALVDWIEEGRPIEPT